jgi:hypothetical protein
MGTSKPEGDPMILIPVPAFTSERTYVVKLHRDADPRHGRLVGRVEHLESGVRIEFATGAALIAAILRHAAGVGEERPS